MNDYLQRNAKSSCKDCYKCIRHCPVKSIGFSGNQAQIIEDECILCGNCFVVCPQHVKRIRSDREKVSQALEAGRPVIASIAPSFVANYEFRSIASMEIALQKLGFYAAGETAVGATIVKKHYEDMIRGNRQKVIISSCCHTVNSLIQKYYPEALPYLAPVVSPMQAHCMQIKKEHPQAYTVFIGPCISKKEEADKYPGIVDCVLTFAELSAWLAEEEIEPVKAAADVLQGRARLFPTAGGILRSMHRHDSHINYISIDGIEKCVQALQEVIAGNINNCFIEMSACVGSCIGGPAMDHPKQSPIREFLAVNSSAGLEDFAVELPPRELLRKEIAFIGLHRQMPGSKHVDDILRKMGKTAPEHELNCGSCGYNTCREKAVAVYFRKADLTMCLPYLKEKAESFSDTIISNTPNGILVLNEELEVQQINTSACQLFGIRNMQEIVGSPVETILDAGDYAAILVTETNIANKKIYLEKFNKYVKETVIYDKNYHIIIIIMRDVTEEEIARAKKEQLKKHTMDTADRVIEKQMRVVQEIASLLGETTAETKIALTKLKETLNDE